MQSIVIATLLAIVLIAAAEPVCFTDPSRCDFNIPSIHAGHEQIMCAPGRNIGNVFTLDFTVNNKGVGSPSWAIVLYFAGGAAEELPKTSQGGHIRLDVHVSNPNVERITLKNKNKVFSISASGTIYLNANEKGQLVQEDSFMKIINV
jgi:hypothetical protein